METQQIFGLLVIFLFITSILGYSFFLGGTGEPTPPNGQGTQTDPEITAPSFFESEIMDANVIELFPSLTLTATTTQADKTKLEKDLQEIPGILQVNSSYRTPDQGIVSGELLYLANISFDESIATPTEILDAINEIPDLQGSQIFRLALLQTSLKTKLTNLQDPQEVREYNFQEPLAQGFIGLTRQKGDVVPVIVQLAIQGGVVTQKIAIETIPEQASFTPHTYTETVAIATLNETVRFSGVSTLPEYTKLALEENLQAIEGIEEVNLEDILEPSTIGIEVESENSLLEDVNSFFAFIPGTEQVNEVSETDGVFTYAITFNEREYVSFREDAVIVLSEIQAKTGTEPSLIDPSVIIEGTLVFEDSQSAGMLEAETLVLASLIDAVILQEGTVTLPSESITVEEVQYIIEGELEKTAYVSIGHSAGDEISVTIQSLLSEESVLIASILEASIEEPE